tara:strand:+ start:192 stop:500 length:309 start_codon:yes stop_codon:yes gene_type:complete
MNKEAQRIAIAKACGRKVRLVVYNRGTVKSWVSEGKEPIPDYLNNLNAMHKAEEVLMANLALWDHYSILLTIAGGYTNGFRATAAQRAEAFLKTLDKWEEAE